MQTMRSAMNKEYRRRVPLEFLSTAVHVDGTEVWEVYPKVSSKDFKEGKPNFEQPEQPRVPPAAAPQAEGARIRSLEAQGQKFHGVEDYRTLSEGNLRKFDQATGGAKGEPLLDGDSGGSEQRKLDEEETFTSLSTCGHVSGQEVAGRSGEMGRQLT